MVTWYDTPPLGRISAPSFSMQPRGAHTMKMAHGFGQIWTACFRRQALRFWRVLRLPPSLPRESPSEGGRTFWLKRF